MFEDHSDKILANGREKKRNHVENRNKNAWN